MWFYSTQASAEACRYPQEFGGDVATRVSSAKTGETKEASPDDAAVYATRRTFEGRTHGRDRC
jgi:hypothetical protein